MRDTSKYQALFKALLSTAKHDMVSVALTIETQLNEMALEQLRQSNFELRTSNLEHYLEEAKVNLANLIESNLNSTSIQHPSKISHLISLMSSPLYRISFMLTEIIQELNLQDAIREILRHPEPVTPTPKSPSEADYRAEIQRLRAVLHGFATGWDCDSDAHKYDTPCRCCESEKALDNTLIED